MRADQLFVQNLDPDLQCLCGYAIQIIFLLVYPMKSIQPVGRWRYARN